MTRRSVNPIRRSEDQFDRDFKRFARFGIGLWLVGALVTLAFWGAVIWGIVALVQHFTN